MASKEQSVTLLRRNKRAMVNALNSIGFNLTEGARVADFPMYIKWSTGLLDVTVAANRKSDNKKFFFTAEEWQALSFTEQNLFLLRGVRVRAWGQSFIIAPDNITNKAWGIHKDVPNAYNFITTCDLYRYYRADEATQTIIDAYDGVTGSVNGAPAAEAAAAYKAFTLERDGLEDDSVWCLPTLAHLAIMFRYRSEIERLITAVWSSDFKFLDKMYWSSCNRDFNNAYRLIFLSGAIDIEGKTQLGCVRPITLT